MVAAAELRLRSVVRGRVADGVRVTPVQPSSERRFQLAPGVALFATATGLVARAPGRWLRIDLHDRRLEHAIVEELERDRLDAEAFPEATLSPLRERDLLVPWADPGRDAGVPPHVWVGAPDDAHLGERVLAAVEHGEDFVVAWIDERGAAVARHDPCGRGCPACAWRADSSLSRYLAMGVELGGAPRAFGGRASLREWVRERATSGVDLPAGCVAVRDALTGYVRVEIVIAHPSCVCASRPMSTVPPDTTWDALAPARYAPVWPVERASGDRAARVVFRRSRVPWKADASALGVALAAGPNAETRALAEAIERYCFLHAPPRHAAASARSLDAPALDAETIRSLLYRSDEYEQPGFRFTPYDIDTPQPFCAARSIEGDREAWIPASLVGRPPHGSIALTDPTSNGYAAHHERAHAIEKALLELIERDAVLLHWYAPLGPLPRIDVDLGLPRSRALLATLDVDLPVVLALGVQEDGSLRCGAAADVTIDAALERARGELAVALGGRAPRRPIASVAAVAQRFEPDDHLRWYSGERGRRAYEAATGSARVMSLAALRRRWPAGAPALASITGALSRRGLDAWIVDRSLPEVFGRGWHVVRALVPGLIELSWGLAYRRLASPRVRERLAAGAALTDTPHPLA